MEKESQEVAENLVRYNQNFEKFLTENSGSVLLIFLAKFPEI